MRKSRLLRHVRLGVKTLMLHKLRSFLTVLGVVFGVGSVIAMLSVGEGASKEALDQIRKLGSNNIILRAVKPAEDEQAATKRSFMSIYGLLYDDEQRIRQTMPAVRRTVPVKSVRKEGRLGERAMELRIMGVTPDWFELLQRQVIAGRVLSWRDVEARSSVCVLTELGARKLLATESTIGQSIRIGGDVFEVVGIVQAERVGGAIQAPDEEVDSYIPVDVARERYGDITTRQTTGSFEREFVELHMILVEVTEDDQVEPTAAAIESMLKRFHVKTDYRVNVPLALRRQAQATKRMMNWVLGSIGGISLLVGGIGIMNIMLASVTERTREIGIRRAIGAKRRQIVGQFLIETIVLSSLGGLIGVGLGVGLPFLITYFANMPTVVPMYGIVLSVAISVGIGILFGLYPAVRAANLDPIEALRHE
jgi:putative ABC transport system permease protein